MSPRRAGDTVSVGDLSSSDLQWTVVYKSTDPHQAHPTCLYGELVAVEHTLSETTLVVNDMSANFTITVMRERARYEQVTLETPFE